MFLDIIIYKAVFTYIHKNIAIGQATFHVKESKWTGVYICGLIASNDASPH